MKKKIYITTAVFAFLIILVIFIAAQTPVNSTAAADYLLSFLGWDIDKKPIETELINLPPQFDEVYNEYNKLQRQAGFDLTAYKGKKAMRYTFAIKNFEGEKGVRANVLMYNGKIIGGDIMTVAIDGFMLPLRHH